MSRATASRPRPTSATVGGLTFASLVVLTATPVNGLTRAAAAAASEVPACSAEAMLEPARAVVGQQVLWRVRILSRDDVSEISWIDRPAFPDVRTERLQERPSSVTVEREGQRYRMREEQRTLFPERPGRLPIRSPGLRCTLPGGVVVNAPIPDAELFVEAPPKAGQPEGFTGLIGPAVVATHVDRRELALGGSVGVSVSLRGTGNLWDVRDPFAALDFADAEWFAHPPTEKIAPGTSLSVQRIFRYDLVPHSEGTLSIPAVRVPYFDPKSGAYAVASTESVDIRVGPRARTALDSPAASRTEHGTRPPRDDSRSYGSGWLAWGAVTGALGIAAALVGGRVFRTRRGAQHAREAQAEAEQSRSAGDRDAEAAALARSLRAALAPHLGDRASEAPSRLLSDAGLAPHVVDAIRMLDAVERARFDPTAAPPDSRAVKSAITRL